MNTTAKFYTGFSREVYRKMRITAGCPPVIATRLRPKSWGWYVEMKDGSFSIDSVSDVSDVWEAKCKCIQGWLDMKGEHDGQ